MLQTRSAKRPAQAAVRFAVDAVEEGLLSQAGGDRDDRRRRRSTRCCTRPSTPTARYDVLARGVAASPGAAKGAIVFTAAEAVEAGRRGSRRDPRAAVHRGRRRRRLPRRRRDPHLRGRQGLARGAGRARHGRPGGHRRGRAGDRLAGGRGRGSASVVLHAGDSIAIDGTHRRDHRRRRAAGRGRQIDARLRDGARLVPTSCARSACARTPTRRRTPRGARRFGAEGIGLCRTEHMFMAAERQPKMRRDDHGRHRRGRAPGGAG